MKITITQKDPHSRSWFNHAIGGTFEVREQLQTKHGTVYELTNGNVVNARYCTVLTEPAREDKRVMKVIEKGGAE